MFFKRSVGVIKLAKVFRGNRPPFSLKNLIYNIKISFITDKNLTDCPAFGKNVAQLNLL